MPNSTFSRKTISSKAWMPGGTFESDYEKKPVRTAGSSLEKYHTESENMQAAFELKDRESAVRSVSQWGNFRYRDDSRTATAGRCDYDAHKAILVLSESPLIVSRETGSTSGELVEYDQRQKLLLVHKRVRSKLAANGGAFFGASNTSPASLRPMNCNTGWKTNAHGTREAFSCCRKTGSFNPESSRFLAQERRLKPGGISCTLCQSRKLPGPRRPGRHRRKRKRQGTQKMCR